MQGTARLPSRRVCLAHEPRCKLARLRRQGRRCQGSSEITRKGFLHPRHLCVPAVFQPLHISVVGLARGKDAGRKRIPPWPQQLAVKLREEWKAWRGGAFMTRQEALIQTATRRAFLHLRCPGSAWRCRGSWRPGVPHTQVTRRRRLVM